MQEQFEQLVLTDDELARLWNEATFVFDTNVLLDLYTHDKSTTEDLLSAIKALEGRLFMPHQVLVEFARNRSSAINQAKTPFDEADNSVDEWEDAKAGLQTLKGKLNSRKTHVREDLLPLDDAFERLSDEIEDIVSDLREQIEESREQHLVTRTVEVDPEEDRVLEVLFDCFKDRVGQAYDQDQYEKIISDAEWRKERKIPPGFEDITSDFEDADDEDKSGYYQYGDQVLWHQIQNYVESEEVDIILVSGDTQKGDWRKGELRREFARRHEKQLRLYTPKEFLKEARDRLNLDISQESVGAMEEEKEDSFLEIRDAYRKMIDSYNNFTFLVEKKRYVNSSQEANKFWNILKDVIESEKIIIPQHAMSDMRGEMSLARESMRDGRIKEAKYSLHKVGEKMRIIIKSIGDFVD